MLKILVMSKGQIQDFDLNNYVVINYYDFTGVSLFETQKKSIGKNKSIITAHNNNDILAVCVDDIEVNKKTIIKSRNKNNGSLPITLFNHKNAEDIIKFAEHSVNRNIIVQCDYGKSRSLTTALFLRIFVLNSTHKLITKEIKIRNKSIFNILKKKYLFNKN